MLAKRYNVRLTRAEIGQALAPFQAQVSPEVAQMIIRYIELLLLWNQHVNLTRITEPKEILRRHFGESMLAAGRVPILGGRLADVGSGAGFPGLGLKLAVPSLQVTLIEANAKKAAFLSEVIRQLGLQDVLVFRRRLEQIKAEDVQANIITARAVGNLPSVLSWSRKHLISPGHVVLWLGSAECDSLAGMPGWTWRKPIGIPHSDRAFLLVGSPN